MNKTKQNKFSETLEEEGAILLSSGIRL